MGRYPLRWHPLIWSILWFIAGFLALLSGFISNHDSTKVVGAVLVFAAASGYFTSSVKSEHRAKRALEVVFTLLSFGLVVYGYVITGSLILGVLSLFIAVIIAFAFVATVLLPRIRGRSESTFRVPSGNDLGK